MNDNESRLQQEILDDARKRADRALARARQDAAKALEAARAECAARREERLEAARKEAEEKCRAITAGIAHELQRRWLTLREERLAALLDDVLRRAESGAGIDAGCSLPELLEEAVAAVGPGELVVRLNPACAARLPEAEVASICGRVRSDPEGPTPRVVVDANLGAGVVVASADGRRRFDNTYATRLERLRRDLRALVTAGVMVAESDGNAHA